MHALWADDRQPFPFAPCPTHTRPAFHQNPITRDDTTLIMKQHTTPYKKTSQLTCACMFRGKIPTREIDEQVLAITNKNSRCVRPSVVLPACGRWLVGWMDGWVTYTIYLTHRVVCLPYIITSIIPPTKTHPPQLVRGVDPQWHQGLHVRYPPQGPQDGAHLRRQLHRHPGACVFTRMTNDCLLRYITCICCGMDDRMIY